MKKNKILVLGSIAFDYLMGFEENFINAVSMDQEKGEYQSTSQLIVEYNILEEPQEIFHIIWVF